ncbi:unnamed protein product [Merluccius merluccius]
MPIALPDRNVINQGDVMGDKGKLGRHTRWHLSDSCGKANNIDSAQCANNCAGMQHRLNRAYINHWYILWNARNQEGAGTTLGKEVEQVNSFLSRCALSTKYMAKSDGVDILTKKKLFDQVMLASQLTEEKQILVSEMMQHCQYLKDSEAKVQSLMATISVSTETGSYPNGFTEEGSKGLIGLLKRRLQDLTLKQQTVTGTNRGILKPSPRLVEEEDGEIEEEMDWQCDNSSEDEDDTEVVPLQNQTPPHQTLIVVAHAVEEDKRVMVSEDQHRMYSTPNIYLKMLDGPHERKGFLLYRRVSTLV